MSEWTRRVGLWQVGLNLLAAGSVLAGLSCSGGDITGPITGSLEMTTATSGPGPNPDGYTLSIDHGAAQSIGINASLTIRDLAPGAHTVALGNVASNCAVGGENPRTVTIAAGATASVSFAITCTALPPTTGTIAVTTATTGSQPDPDGYTLSLDGGAGQPIGVNATLTLSAVAPGTHAILLTDLAANCSVEGGSSKQATVTAGQKATLSFSVSCPSAAYQAIDLGIGAAQPSAINAAGQVVGASTPGQAGGHAFLWAKGIMTDLGTLGGSTSEATGINAAGQVVGWSWTTAAGEHHAFLWAKGVMTDLGTLGGSTSDATGINDAGQVVGWSRTAAGEIHSFLWAKGVMTDLGGQLYATGINAAGQVVGSGQSGAVIWAQGIVTDLGMLPGDESALPTGINDAGQVVGHSDGHNGDIHRAFFWTKGVMTQLGPLSGEATGINAAGQVVGFMETRGGGDHAFLWAKGVMTDLDPGQGSRAFGINDGGQVVGVSWTPDGGRHATLWTRE